MRLASDHDTPRRALTLTFTSPFFKQQLDYARLVGFPRAPGFPFLKQMIGYNARVRPTWTSTTCRSPVAFTNADRTTDMQRDYDREAKAIRSTATRTTSTTVCTAT